MPTSNDSPTAGEIAQDDVPTGDTAVAEPVETNFPAAVEVDETPDAELMDQASILSDAEEGSIWATYVGEGASVVERTLTVADLRGLGWRDAETPLVWDRNNRHIVEITDVHPLVLRYIEEQDGAFKVERF